MLQHNKEKTRMSFKVTLAGCLVDEVNHVQRMMKIPLSKVDVQSPKSENIVICSTKLKYIFGVF